MSLAHKANQEYLACQYRNASNLNARIDLHQRFSTNKYGWQRWIFDQLDLPLQCRILELGCGPGNLWLENLDRIPESWDIVLSDFSAGMLLHYFRVVQPFGRPAERVQRARAARAGLTCWRNSYHQRCGHFRIGFALRKHSQVTK